MPVDSILLDRARGRDLLVTAAPFDGAPVLVIQSMGQAFGVFQSITGSVAGTIVVATANVGETIVITDILISAKKKAGSTLTLRFNDGTDTENIFSPDTVQAEVNFAVPLAGRWLGWTGADLEVVTVADVDYTASIGYYKVAGGDDFATWDAKR